MYLGLGQLVNPSHPLFAQLKIEHHGVGKTRITWPEVLRKGERATQASTDRRTEEQNMLSVQWDIIEL